MVIYPIDGAIQLLNNWGQYLLNEQKNKTKQKGFLAT